MYLLLLSIKKKKKITSDSLHGRIRSRELEIIKFSSTNARSFVFVEHRKERGMFKDLCTATHTHTHIYAFSIL